MAVVPVGAEPAGNVPDVAAEGGGAAAVVPAPDGGAAAPVAAAEDAAVGAAAADELPPAVGSAGVGGGSPADSALCEDSAFMKVLRAILASDCVDPGLTIAPVLRKNGSRKNPRPIVESSGYPRVVQHLPDTTVFQ